MNNVDFSRPRKSCETCDWPVWHVCLVGKEDRVPEILQKESQVPKPKYDKNRKRNKYGPPRAGMHHTDEGRYNIGVAQRERWAKVHKLTRARDERILQEREGGSSIRSIAKRYNIGHTTVAKILERMMQDE